MEDDQELKHMCKFCYKSFPCGRSLGGHMRSHLINIPFDHNQKTDKKLLQKKLPPPINPKIDDFVQDGGKFGSEKPKEKSKLCKECGKSFQSWKALFGHMKCHSVNGKAAGRVEDDSWNSSNESDDESATLLCRKKRSEKMKRYTSTTDSCSFNMIPDFSPCDSEIDQHEEEEVALSLILLSRDSIGNSRSADSAIDSSDNSSEFLQANKNSLSNNNNSKSKLEKLIKKRGMDQFEADLKKEKSNKRKLIDSHDSTTFSIQKSPSETDFDSTGKFTCTVCKKAFASYQALGGHRASHKKFNGCCAPVTENIHENVKSTNPKLIKKPMSSENLIIAFAAKAEAKLGLKKNKEHECPICFKVFQSGQALGGHKRSHVVANQAKLTNHPNAVIQKPEARDFLDLNLPAPDEVGEQSNVFKLWWIGPQPKPEPLLGLLSS